MKKEEPYEKLQFYKNILILRNFITKITKRLGKSHYRVAGHMRDSIRGAKQNTREGYKNDSALVFARFIKISLGSLEELAGDLEDCFEDKLIAEEEFRFGSDLIGKTCYMMGRYLDSLYKLHREGKWKKRWSLNP